MGEAMFFVSFPQINPYCVIRGRNKGNSRINRSKIIFQRRSRRRREQSWM
jgi:hypothetical protein